MTREIPSDEARRTDHERRWAAVARLLGGQPISWPEVEEEFPRLSQAEAAEHCAGRLADPDQQLWYEAIFALHPGLAAAACRAAESAGKDATDERSRGPGSAPGSAGSAAPYLATALGLAAGDAPSEQRFEVRFSGGSEAPVAVVFRSADGALQIRLRIEKHSSAPSDVRIRLESADGDRLSEIEWRDGASNVAHDPGPIRPLDETDLLIVEQMAGRAVVRCWARPLSTP